MRMIQMVGQVFLIGWCCFAVTGQAIAGSLTEGLDATRCDAATAVQKRS